VYKVTAEKCEGCGNCVDVCPSGAITLVDKVAIINYDECAECGACESECPSQSIAEA
jgi:ferredoxin